MMVELFNLVHHIILDKNFTKPFNIKFQNKEGKEEYGYQTSWGISTRLLGGVIMAHGDDRGLKLPPKSSTNSDSYNSSCST